MKRLSLSVLVAVFMLVVMLAPVGQKDSVWAESATFYYNRGNEEFKKGQYDRAIADYNKALDLNPKIADAYNNRAVAYYYQKDYDKAWKDVHKAQSLGYKVHPGFLKALRQASGRDK